MIFLWASGGVQILAGKGFGEFLGGVAIALDLFEEIV